MSSISARFRKSKAKNAHKVAARKSSIPRAMSRISTSMAKKIVSKGSELKVIDNSITQTGVDATDATGNIFCLNAVTQGTGLNERVGAKITPKSIMVRCKITPSFHTDVATGILAGNFLRIMLVWQDDGGSIPTLNNIVALISSTTPPVATSDRSAGKNLLSPDQYRILTDDTIAFTPNVGFIAGAVGATQYAAVYWEKYLDLSKKNLLTRFQATANPPTIAQIAEGSLLLVLSAYANSVLTTVDVRANCRFRFNDT